MKTGGIIAVVAEHEDGKINRHTLEVTAFALMAGASSGMRTVVIIPGNGMTEAGRLISEESGADVVLLESPHLENYTSEGYKAALHEFLMEYVSGIVMVPHTQRGSEYAPGLAVRLGAACITGVNGMKSGNGMVFTRQAFNGKLEMQFRPAADFAVITVMPGAAKPEFCSSGPGSVAAVSSDIELKATRYLGVKKSGAEDSGIENADVIVSAGRGIGGVENIGLITGLAGLFDRSAVGCSRIVCDRGWMEYGRQIGITGKTVSPKLYIACGISGAVQHLAGMSGSGFIVAVNRDPEAPIFKHSDVCVVEDLNGFLPEFIEEIRKRRAG
ncbi:MAG: electron transfer flavoprotein subunit alpha/FixB family protein [Spirochaetes bacterium]|jgi:electron transfer flavoprotein alpha subunit|nr:electron transfer flavoprotein subunit alpha/FixB family protein [Spirochaetota bacterium]